MALKLKGIELPRVDVGPFSGGSRRAAAQTPADWRGWLKELFPEYVRHDFAPHHEEFWEWLWAVRGDERPKPFVAIWPRGHAKSTNAEMSVVALGARKIKRYVLYVCGTQDQADDHVQNIADMLESEGVGGYYADLGSPKLGKYGNSRGWRRNRLRTASGLTVDAIGLDSAARGAKVEEDRPDFIVIDDVDGENDSEKVTEKKIRSLTRKILPAGAENLAVLAVQNLVHPDSIFSRLSDGRAKFLADRIVSGPVPAIDGLEYEERGGRAIIASGAPTWSGMDIPTCQDRLDEEGLDAFLVERQHRIDVFGKPAFRREWWTGKNRHDAGDSRLSRVSYGRFAWLDTANKDEPKNAYTVCVVGEITPDYRLLVRDVKRARKTFDELPEWTVEALRPHANDLKLKGVWIEDAASGTQLLQVLGRSAPAWLRNILWPSQPRGSKEERWGTAAVWCARSCVLLPHPHQSLRWLPEFEEELFALNPEFKDQRDAFAGLINDLEASMGVLSEGWAARNFTGNGAA